MKEKLPQLIMRHPDLSDLPPLEPKNGITLRTHRAGDEAAWEEIIESAFGKHYDFDLLIRLGGYDPSYVIYAERDGKPIATASAVENPKYPGEGWFRMIGAHRDARGLGAGRLVCLAALHSLRDRGYKTAVLSTDDEAFGGWNRIATDITYTAEKVGKKQYGFKMYLPSRTAVCLAKKR